MVLNQIPSFFGPPFGPQGLPPLPQIPRRLAGTVLARLDQFPAVALLGPRQAGKTTLARAIAETRPSLFLDLERPEDRNKLTDPELYLSIHQDRLVILDEVQRAPDLFETLRVLIDRSRAAGRPSGHYLLLGSASESLLKQSSESLAGRIAHVELGPFDIIEVDRSDRDRLWLRGGFPDSLRAPNDERSFVWRENFIRTYLERDIQQFAPRYPSETLRRLWTMLAYQQGGLFNASELARGLAIDSKTIARYVDLLVDLFLLRRLEPRFANLGKRLVKSPRIFVRDSGVLHTLLQLDTIDRVLGNPVAGPSWEGFVIENLCAAAGMSANPSFYRTATGDEVDLVVERRGGALWAIEVKLGLAPAIGRGFDRALRDLKPERAFVVYSGTERFPHKTGVEAIGVREMAALLLEDG